MKGQIKINSESALPYELSLGYPFFQILHQALTKNEDEDDVKYGKRVRDTHTKYNLKSNQAHNCKMSKGGDYRAAAAAPRSKKQMKQTEMS